jgi:hypothetical protein
VIGVHTTDGYVVESSFDRDQHGELFVPKMTAHGRQGRKAVLRAEGVWEGKPTRRVRFLLGRPVSRGAETAVPFSAGEAAEALEHIIHVPGLRTPPQRDYPLTATGETFAGRFDVYVASVLLSWQREKDPRVGQTGRALQELGLTWKVRAEPKADTMVSLYVGRLPRGRRGGAKDLVELADVGVGVSQALPVIVALLCAQAGQVVYLEQPELHLHPRAQNAMARLLVQAAARGVRVVVETHSSMLLLGIREHVISGTAHLDPSDVILHWFTRKSDGAARIDSAELNEAGAFGDVPADFDDVELDAHRRYLDALEALDQ